MGVSSDHRPKASQGWSIRDASFEYPLSVDSPEAICRSCGPTNTRPFTRSSVLRQVLSDDLLRTVQQSAEIDISGSEFEFVRSIRVFDVQIAEQFESRYDGDCVRQSSVALGVYGEQGEFSWIESSIYDLPPAHLGLERWGAGCATVSHRTVFVEWRDFGGNYGYEQIDY